ncbi:receptor-type tyrosine-protein phosphatase U-like protein [Camelus ferus]|nr:receptor-type tyrosine-protein phosphatase U-like protein [Camelus ferus]
MAPWGLPLPGGRESPGLSPEAQGGLQGRKAPGPSLAVLRPWARPGGRTAAHLCCSLCTLPGGTTMPAPSARDQHSSGVTEASSLLGGSPRRPSGQKGSPYYTGQLHPAVHVADLPQHINQMKTAEGYSFKQESEVHGSSPARTPPFHTPPTGLSWRD